MATTTDETAIPFFDSSTQGSNPAYPSLVQEFHK